MDDLLCEGFFGDVPFVLTKSHNTVFYYWWRWGIENAHLLHIDYHADNSGHTRILSDVCKANVRSFTRQLGIAGFICAGAHEGMIAKCDWYNPYQDIIFPFGNMDTWEVDGRVLWAEHAEAEKVTSGPLHERPVMLPWKLKADEPFACDIDFDGFSCTDEFEVATVPLMEERIQNSVSILSSQPRPQGITMTTSTGTDMIHPRPYTPLQHVPFIQKNLFLKLENLYGHVKYIRNN